MKPRKIVPVKRAPSCPCGCGDPHHDVSPLFCLVPSDDPLVERALAHEGQPEAPLAFARMAGDFSSFAYWFVLGSLWTSDAGATNLDLWRHLFRAPVPNRAACLMKPSEVRALRGAVLGRRDVRAWRAHRPDEADWLSFTLDRLVAERVASEQPGCVVREYRVPVRDIVALFLRRGEQEILVLDRRGLRAA